MFEQILETGSPRPLKGRSLGGGGLHIYIYICRHTRIHMSRLLLIKNVA